MSPCDIPEDIISFFNLMYKNTQTQILLYGKIDEKTNKRLYYEGKKKAQVMVKVLNNLCILYPDLILDNYPRY